MKKIIIVLLVIIVIFLGYISYNNYLANQSRPDFAIQNQDKDSMGWKSMVWNDVSFQYPSSWTVETINTRTEEERLILQGPSSENQIISVTKVGSVNWNLETFNFKTINNVDFAIPKGLSEDSQKIFLQITASAK